MAANEVYQYSLVSALMDGVASNGVPITTLLSNGDHGLGTFKCMRGEMIIVDGKVYQMKSDGSIVPFDSPQALEQISPFATVTRFEATSKIKTAITSKDGLFDLVTGLLPNNQNHFIGIRIDGNFKSIRVRTAEGQKVPGQSLREVAKQQTEHVFRSVSGTIIGFRCPKFVSGLNVAGDHLHFITDDRQRGGHILALEADEEVELSVAPLLKLHLELPEGDEDFNNATLIEDAKGIKVAEG
ncbi:alpha-acetolactate decarboxylase [Mariannaea sp. PMI_226]|nr:alpha-acetolactate decarboxylase [Mariannaea sp. PMI_226]